MKVKVGDKVAVIKGKDRGKRGVIVAADHTSKKVKVEGVNVYQRHQRRSNAQKAPGGKVEIIAPLDVAKVQLICPNCSAVSRVGYQEIDGKRERICKKCKAVIQDAKK